MGFFGSSKNRQRDPFQAAVEQQRRRTPVARLQQRESESARRYNADFLRRGPFGWPANTTHNPYQQPAFGFYSGDNLATGKSRHPERPKSINMDQGFRNEQQGFLYGTFGQSLPFPDPYLHQGLPWVGLGPEIPPAPWDSPYAGRRGQFQYPGHYHFGDYCPTPAMPAPNRPMPPHVRRFPPRRTAMDMPMYPDSPTFGSPRPFENNPPMADQDPFPDPPPMQPRPRPPGSYERLRPPHLQGG